MLTVHHLGASQSERVLWLCEELDVSYELESYARLESMAAPPEYKALHPAGTSPIITDDGFALAESGAIVEYICNRLAGGRLVIGTDSPDYIDYLFWFHYANGSMVPGLMLEHMASQSGSAGTSRAERAFALAETRLGEAEYFAGDTFSAADIMMCLPRFCERRDLTGSPNTAAYIERMLERPAYQRVLEIR